MEDCRSSRDKKNIHSIKQFNSFKIHAGILIFKIAEMFYKTNHSFFCRREMNKYNLANNRVRFRLCYNKENLICLSNLESRDNLRLILVIFLPLRVEAKEIKYYKQKNLNYQVIIFNHAYRQ